MQPVARPLVRAPLALTLAVVVAGCYWLRYRELALTHVELIETMASDAVASLAAGEGHDLAGLAPEDIARLRYPLERARDFATISRRRQGPQPWLERFDEMLVRYEELVTLLDRRRVRSGGGSGLGRLEQRLERVRRKARAVRAALEIDT